MVENEGLITNILASFGMAIPTELTDEGFLRDFEDRLTDFSRLRNFLLNTKPEKFIKEDLCKGLFNSAKAIDTEISKRLSLSKGDLWSITFLKSVNESDFVAFIKVIGPIYYLIKVAKDIDNNKDALTKNLKAAISIYLFQNLYELVMGNVDACLYVYLNRNPQVRGTQYINKYRKDYIEERKQKRSSRTDRGEHATAGMISGILGEIYDLECRTDDIPIDAGLMSDTIFNAMTKDLRNASAHLNAFYDEKLNKIVFLDGTQISMEEFIALYERMFLFLYRWMDMYLGDAKGETDFVKKIYEEIGNMLDSCLRLMLEIGRSGKQKYWYIFIQNTWGNSTVKFEKKQEQELTNQKR
ncbi:MAG: hypothetical protein QXL94_02795 [Candidatus Parvarchaeum sp.]